MFFLYLVFAYLTCRYVFALQHDEIRPVVWLVVGVGIFGSSVAAKEVLIFKERLDDVANVIRMGDCFYHALTARTNACLRQPLLAYSRVFNK